MQIVPFKQVDVFTARALGGNPVAVILDAEALDATQMQRIARWTNLSETAFVLSPTTPEASYRVRIFTPTQELPFAGHPSVGTAHAVLEAQLATARDGCMLQECAAGLLPIQVGHGGDGRQLSIRAPHARRMPLPENASRLIDAALDGRRRGAIAAQLFDNGPLWWLVELEDAGEVRTHVPDLAAITALTQATKGVGLAVFAQVVAPDHQLVMRDYCPADGIAEDPVTGSANACIGALLLAEGRLSVGDSYVASQGREVGRDGFVRVALCEDGVWIGGSAVTVIDGMIRFDD
jgi:PhzF family phenazine biosynthesis protein